MTLDAAHAILEALEPWAEEWLTEITDATLSVFEYEMRQAIEGYMVGLSPVRMRNDFQRAVVNHWMRAARLGWVDGGGSLDELPMSVMATEQGNQLNFANRMWDGFLRETREKLRRGEITLEQATRRTNDRIAMWTDSLRGWYREMRFRAKGRKGEKMAIWHLGGTKETCNTCEGLANGKKRPLSWYLGKNYIPGKGGSAMICGGWRCQCSLEIVKTGERFSLYEG
jgi:hypothetical protein